ncbi:MAG: 2-hydroxychromene-2-carboxylate isomerase [Acidiferrobacteraceae bacterium]|nr:2-hydroxychromene-2-carboxylate isomerase [Acidiferrobacteraceae bacterium]
MTKQMIAWLSIGSTYTYLTAMRIQAVLNQHNIELTIKPFSIRDVMKEIDNIPFPPSKPWKVNYMWRDIERRAIRYGIPPPIVPAPYPLKDLDGANRVGMVMHDRGRYLEYFEATYRSWFLDGNEAGGETNQRHYMSTMGLDYDEVMATACSDDIRDRYRANTSEALQMGIFGAPSFTRGKEIFWGDDRLEDAIGFEK